MPSAASISFLHPETCPFLYMLAMTAAPMATLTCCVPCQGATGAGVPQSSVLCLSCQGHKVLLTPAHDGLDKAACNTASPFVIVIFSSSQFAQCNGKCQNLWRRTTSSQSCEQMLCRLLSGDGFRALLDV
jgi:hypothetical protein